MSRKPTRVKNTASPALAAGPEDDAAFAPAVRLLPLVAALILPPLVLRRADMGLPLEAVGVWYRNDDIEFMTWWKSVCVVAASGWMLIAAAWRLRRGWRPRAAVWGVLCLVPLLVTLLSALSSTFPDTVWIGFPEHYEGFYVCAALLVMAWYATESIRDRGEVRLLIFAMTPAFLVNAALGIAQSYGWDFLSAEATAFLAGVPAGQIRLHQVGVSSGALPNPNAFSRYMAMFAVLSLGMLVGGKKRGRWFWSFCLLVSLWAVLTNFTRGGVVALLAGGVIVAATAGRNVLRSGSRMRRNRLRPIQIVAAAVLLGAVLASAVFFRGALASSFPNFGRLADKFFGTVDEAADGGGFLLGISLHDNRVGLHTVDGVITVGKAGDGWFEAPLLSSAATPLVPGSNREESEAATLVSSLMPGFALERETRDGKDVTMRLDGIDFALRERNGILYGMDGSGNWSRRIALPRAAVFGDMPGLFSGRGYVWSRALGVFGERPFLGSGPDTFCLVFPNDEIVRKARIFPGEVVIDKADGSWAHTLVTLGALGTVAWLLPAAFAFARAWRMASDPLAAALAATATVYVVGGLVTNSTVETGPCFWILCGMIVALRRFPAASD